jgi:hypothetical protein
LGPPNPRSAAIDRAAPPNIAQSRCHRTLPIRVDCVGPGATAFGKPGRNERETDEQRQHALDRLVRAELFDRHLAEHQAQGSPGRRPDQEPDQEGDAVRARALASDHDEHRSQHDEARGRDQHVEEHVPGGGDHPKQSGESSMACTGR